MIRAMALAGAVFWAAGAQAATVGLLGEFWDVGSVRSLTEAEAAIAAGGPDLSFVATAIDYPQGSGRTVQSRIALADFLGADAASLSLGPAATLEGSVFRFSGFLDLDAGLRSFSVGSDDGFRLSIGGVEVSRHAGQRGFGVTTVSHLIDAAGLTPVELIYFENRGVTGVEFRIDGETARGAILQRGEIAVVPLPGAAALMLAALAALGLAGRSRRLTA